MIGRTNLEGTSVFRNLPVRLGIREYRENEDMRTLERSVASSAVFDEAAG